MRTLLVRHCCAGLAVLANFSGPLLAAPQETFWRECRPNEKRYTCVVDGDTLWFGGAKIRLIGIDAPEVNGRCSRERQLAQKATTYLVTLLRSGLIRIEYDGKDRYSRHLARLWVRLGEVGPDMIASGLAIATGLAEPFGQRGPSPWCLR